MRRVVVSVPAEQMAAVTAFAPEVYADLFIVSEVEFVEGAELSCEVLPANGEKCPRCWNYRGLADDGLCPRCHEALA